MAHGGGDEELLVSMVDYMSTFKQLMVLSTETDMNTLCQQYSGLYTFSHLLERLAGGIATGSIPVPE